MKCSTCQDKLFLQEGKGKKLIPCPYCMTEERLIGSIKRAIADLKKEGNTTQMDKLQSVLNFLPDYPVMALLEAEALKLSDNLILMIRDTFKILPFGDVEYKKKENRA